MLPSCCGGNDPGVKTLRTMMRLGARSVARVAAYRLGVMSGLHRVRHIVPQPIAGSFFRSPETAATPGGEAAPRPLRYFGWLDCPVTGSAPDWFANPLTGRPFPPSSQPWWAIPDFGPDGDDIKILWEPSRFGWALDLALAAGHGHKQAADRLNDWLRDWCEKNPAYSGHNWKCGQEASIRVMHLAMAQLLLGCELAPAPALEALLVNHLQRIAPTIGYAVGQNNNHGTSEAAALFIGGSWLERAGIAQGRRWYDSGRKWLEDRARALIAADGSFSQYSLNYHRMVLDSFAMAEIWRRRLALPAFSSQFLARSRAATEWLYQMIDPASGDGPNLGANDGAHLFDIGQTPYRDFRPTVQTASVLFAGQRAYPGDGVWNGRIAALGLELPDAVRPAQTSARFDDGGFTLLRIGAAMAMLRYPRFRFRPSQCDALHVDLWLAGENLLGDAGSFSYNCDEEWMAYFPGSAGHNSIMFDGRDQMPRLGRFLFGDWLEAGHVSATRDSAEACYIDAGGASHRRVVRLEQDRLIVTDMVTGFAAAAVLRWRLRQADWRHLSPHSITDGSHRITVETDAGPGKLAIVPGWRSLHYWQKEEIPVASLEVNAPATITTTYSWAS